MKRLHGKVVLVTGAANGIGFAVAKRVVGEGAKVFLVDIDKERLSHAARMLGAAAAYQLADVTDEQDTRNYIDAAIQAFGRIDVAVLNAGIEGPIAPIEDTPTEAFDKVLAVNVRGVWLGLSSVFPVMRSMGGGSIVMMSSIAGLRGRARMAPYTTSKHAVIGMMKSAALEGAAHGIRVNAVCPASTDTRMMDAIDQGSAPDNHLRSREQTMARIPLKRYGTPDEVANLVLFLASEESSFTTGAAYLVDGGAMAGLAV